LTACDVLPQLRNARWMLLMLARRGVLSLPAMFVESIWCRTNKEPPGIYAERPLRRTAGFALVLAPKPNVLDLADELHVGRSYPFEDLTNAALAP